MSYIIYSRVAKHASIAVGVWVFGFRVQGADLVTWLVIVPFDCM